MPIKFRCQHCKQFLGISRSKAGEVVDCPSCGRGTRVPALDGTRLPIADPGIDENDESLMSALGELAHLGEGGTDDDLDPQPDATVRGTPEPIAVAVPVKIPEPISVAAPLPAEIVTPAASARLRPAEPSGDGLSDLASLASGGGGPTGKRWSLPLLLCVGLLIGGAFVGGMAVGPVWKTDRVATDGSDARTADDPQSDVEGDSDSTPPSSPVSLAGRVTYKTTEGYSKPDRGARVIAFPKEPAGASKLPIAGFVASPSELDAQIGRETLTLLGGAVARTDEEGRYTLSLPAPGEYRLLIVSRYQNRSGDAPADAGLDRLLATWFSPPGQAKQQVIGFVPYHLSTLRHDGDGIAEFDHSFDRDG